MRNRPYPLYHTLPELDNLRQMLEIKASAVPNEVAFRYMQGRKNLVEHTYYDFYQEVRWLGNYLLKRGVRGRKIALMGENTYQWLVCYFAIVTSGNVAVLLAKDFTEEEAAVLLRQTDVDILAASKSCWQTAEAASHKKNTGRKIFLMSFDEMDEWEEKGRMFFERGRNLYDAVVQDNRALSTIFFTSGTSGLSKAVMLSQFNICRDITLTCQLFCPTEGGTIAVLPFNHAFGLVTAVMKPFHYQRPVFINSNLSSFMREIAIAKPHTLFLVPLFIETMEKTIWRNAAKQGVDGKLRRAMKISDGMLKMGIDKRREMFREVLDKFGGHVDYIICGGAALDPKYVKEFRSFGIEILNGYGITECSPVLAVNRNHFYRDGSVGQMVPGLEFRIYQPDEQGVGEIQVKGDNVMMGYYNDEENTREAFLDNYYRTGDLGYIDRDGFLWVTGRKKNLIILNNGENVSPEGIEQQLDRLAEVGEVIVYEEDHAITAEIFPDDASEKSPEEQQKTIEEGIRRYNSTMPNYKKIHKIKFRKTPFEKTATKKIKRIQK